MHNPAPPTPAKLCECGCGNPVLVATQNQPSGTKKGEPARFLAGHRSPRTKREGCEAPDCTGEHFGAGLCVKHYMRKRRHGNLIGKVPQAPAEERFWRYVNKTGECWAWTGGTANDGYGRLYISERDGSVAAHRFSYQLHNGEIPAGLIVCHRCDNPPCVRPDHLFLGTHLDNVRDMFSKGRNVSGMGRRTHCKSGHPFDEENTLIQPGGWRRCRTCRHLSYLRRVARKQGAQ